MQALQELQTGQVAFLSGLLAGFSLTVAASILRLDMRSRVAQISFLALLLTTLLFLIALYVDVRLTIELAGQNELSDLVALKISAVRSIGTTCATAAFLLFIVSIGLLGWLATPLTGVISTVLAGGTLYLFMNLWQSISTIQSAIGAS